MDSNVLREGNHDRAWNDPPVFSYDSYLAKQSQPVKKNVLNKRVAFPSATSQAQISGNLPTGVVGLPPPLASATPSIPPGGNLPPPLSGVNAMPPLATTTLPTSNEDRLPTGTSITNVAPPRACDLPPVENTDSLTNAETSGILVKQETSKDFSQNLLDLRSLLKQWSGKMQKRHVEDVGKRLANLETMWEEKKLPQVVEKRVIELGSAICDGDFESANKIHLSLVVDYGSLCSSWMVGMKHMIHHGQSQSKNATVTEGGSSSS